VRRHTSWGIAAALLAFSAAGVAVAQTATATESQPTLKVQKTQAAVPAGAGQQAALDPAAGTAGEPTPEQIQSIETAMAEMLSRSSEGLQVVEWPDGTLTMDLQGRFQEMIVATVAPDGTVRIGCVNQPGQVRAVLAPRTRQGGKDLLPEAKPLEVK